MIQVEDIDHIPDLPWNMTSEKEFMLTEPGVRDLLLKFSSPIKAIKRGDKVIAVMGLFRAVLTDPPFFWALLSRDFDKAAVRALKKVSFPGCITYVEQGNEKAERLARCFGFKLIDGGVLMGETMYDIYRRAG